MYGTLPPPPPPRMVSRDGLLGLLAVERAWIRRDDLAAAFAQRETDSTNWISNWLTAEKQLTAEQIAQLEQAADERLQASGNSLAACVGQLYASVGLAEPTSAGIEAEVTKTFTHASSALESRPKTAAPIKHAGEPRTIFAEGNRFRVLRPHARGGLGEVFIAVDEQVHREVALKEIQARCADSAHSRERFVREAEITGQLEHPGIVPVYGLGTHADGRPYYAMRFIQGESLRTALAVFHESRTPRTRLRGELAVRFRQLLARFISVCQTIHYAHSRRVIHRDLKPDNIMLGTFGETLVVDWGLAKSLETAEPASEPSVASGIVSHSGSSTDTVDGTALGTPQYMSPEQAAGQIQTQGPATDIYSLGATLYALLTGRAPYSRSNQEEMLQRVQRGEFPLPRKLWPAIPPALEAICLKAMAHNPQDRYATAQDLATDLEHWLADEPIAARRESTPDRISRWMRRNRAAALAGVATLLIVCVAALLTTGLSTGALYRAAQARDRELAQLKVAQDATREAKAAAALANEQRNFATQQGNIATEQRNIALAETYRAYLNESRALRAAATPGWRFAATERLSQAAGLNTPQRDLVEVRSEAIACLGDFDVIPKLRLRGHTGTVWSVSFAPDNNLLASQGYEGETRVWNLEEQRELSVTADAAFSGSARHSAAAPIPAVLFQRSGNLLAAAKWDESVVLFDPAEPGQSIKVQGAAQPVNLAFDPSSQQLAVAWIDASVTIHDAQSGKQQQRIKLPMTAAFYSPLAFGPEGKWLATVGPSNRIDVYPLDGASDSTSGDAAEEKLTPKTVGRHRDSVRGLAVSPQGRWMATAACDLTVKLWSLGGESFTEPLTLIGHTGRVNGVAFTPDEQLLLSVSDDGTLRIWETNSGRPLRVVPMRMNALTSVAVDAAGEHIAVGGESGNLAVLRLTARNQRREMIAHNYYVNGVAFHPHEPRMYTCASDKKLVAWDTNTSRPLEEKYVPVNNPVNCLAVSPAGDVFAVGLGQYFTNSGRDFSVLVYDAQTLELKARLPGPQGPVLRIAFDAKGERIAAGADTGHVFVWNVADGKQLLQMQNGPLGTHVLKFTGGGKRVIAGDRAGTLSLLQLDGEGGSQTLATLQVAGGMGSGALSPQEDRLTVATLSSQLQTFSVETDRLEALESLRLPRSAISVAYDAGGKFLAVGDTESVEVRAAGSLAPLFRLQHNSPVGCVAFDPDGWRLAFSGRAAAAIVWDMSIVRAQLATLGLDWEAPNKAKDSLETPQATDLAAHTAETEIVGSAAKVTGDDIVARVRRLRDARDYAAAIQLAQEGLSNAKDPRALWFELAALNYQQQNFSAAEAAAAKHLSLCPNCASATDLLFRSQLVQGSRDEALATAMLWLQSDPEATAPSYRVALALAIAEEPHRDPEELLLHAQRAAALGDVSGGYATLLVSLAHFWRGKQEQAAAAAASAKATPNQTSARLAACLQAIAHHALGDMQQAERHLAAANEPLATSVDPALLPLVRVVSEEAVQAFGAERVTFGASDALRLRMGRLEEAQNHLDAALGSYSAVLEREPTNASARRSRGMLLARRRQWTQAADDLLVYCESNSSDLFAAYQTCLLLAQVERMDEYERLWQQFHDQPQALASSFYKTLVAKARAYPTTATPEQCAVAQMLGKEAFENPPPNLVDWHNLDAAIIAHRQNDHARVLEHVRRAEAGPNVPHIPALPVSLRALRALAQQASGDRSAAVESLAQCDALLREKMKLTPGGEIPIGHWWHDWMVAEQLHREAVAAVNPAGAAAKRGE